MSTIIKIEWLKIRKYKAFWGTLLITLLCYLGINYLFYRLWSTLSMPEELAASFVQVKVGALFAFPAVWQTVAYFCSWFVVLPAALVIMLIANEYTFKTHRQNIIDGWSRLQFISAKMVSVVIVSLIVTAAYTLLSLTLAVLAGGQAASFSLQKMWFIGLFALHTFSQLSFAFMIGFLIGKAFTSLSIFLLYSFIVENVLMGLERFKAYNLGRFLPLQISNRLIPMPVSPSLEILAPLEVDLGMQVVYTLAVTALIWLICLGVFARKDLRCV